MTRLETRVIKYTFVSTRVCGWTFDAPWDEDEDEEAGAEFNLSAKAFDVKLTRQLASEITQKGASMYDALGAENELREDRLRAITRNMDIEDIEQQVGGKGDGEGEWRRGRG